MSTIFPTWIRVQDASGQFDWLKGKPLPVGVTAVKGYPEHVGTSARSGKPFTDKAGAPVGPGETADYSRWKKDQLQAEIDRRNADEDRGIDPVGPTNADLAAALQADDALRESDPTNPDGTPPPAPGDQPGNDETGDAGEGDE